MLVISFRYTVISQLGTGNLEKTYSDCAIAIREGRANKPKQVFSLLKPAYVEDKRFEAVDLTDNAITDKIGLIYSSLSQFKGIRYVGATKIMHLLRPNFFMMWDKKIIEHYKKDTRRGYINTSRAGYVNFMKEMQRRYRNGEFPNLKKDVSIPRAIDLYNLEIR